jgi:RNA polymerase sigma factor (TIGR02999 family)
MAGQPEGVTALLKRWSSGDKQALERLTSAVYDELHRIAGGYLRRWGKNRSLQPTELIGEVYVRLLKNDVPEWNTRTHFFAVASMCMRQIVVDHARRMHAQKRAGVAVTLDDDVRSSTQDAVDVLAVNEALVELLGFDERKARIAELSYFGGMTQEEIAEALSIHTNTVAKDLGLAKAWLKARLQGSP